MDAVDKVGAEAGDEDVEQFRGVVAVGRVVVGLERHEQAVQVILALAVGTQGVNYPLGDRSNAGCSADPRALCGLLTLHMSLAG